MLAEKIGYRGVPQPSNALAAADAACKAVNAAYSGESVVFEFSRDRKSMCAPLSCLRTLALAMLCTPVHDPLSGTQAVDGRALLAVHRPLLYGRSVLRGSSLFVKGAPEGLLPRCSNVLLANGRVEKLDVATRKKAKPGPALPAVAA